VWVGPRESQTGSDVFDAVVPFGRYVAAEEGWFLIGGTVWTGSNGIEAAQSAAKADYEARILAALEDLP
jgi:hypothetical protein